MYRALFICCLVFFVLAGCASYPSKSPQDMVASRAQKHMEFVMEQDFSKALKYVSPASRSRVGVQGYQRMYGGVGMWVAADVSEVKCREEVCDVTLRIEYKIRSSSLTGYTKTSQRWIKLDDEWWIYYKQ